MQGLHAWDLCPSRSMRRRREGLETERDIRDQQWRYDMRKQTRQKVRGAANSGFTFKKTQSCWQTTCRTQNHAAQSDRKKPSEDLAASVFRTSGGGGRGGGGGAAAEITLRPLSFLLGCLLMCVDIGELHPQSRLRSRCPHYSISFHSPRANKARFFCPAAQCAQCAQCACSQRSQCHCKLRVLSSDIQHFWGFLFCPLPPRASLSCTMTTKEMFSFMIAGFF